MEKIQERALRFIYENYECTYEELLLKSGFPSLRIRRLRCMAIEVFKIINKQCPTYLHDIITLKKSNYSFRKDNLAEVPRVRTTGFGLHSVRYAGATLWNELPNEICTQTNLDQFKSLINNWSGSSCKCGSCKS